MYKHKNDSENNLIFVHIGGSNIGSSGDFRVNEEGGD